MRLLGALFLPAVLAFVITTSVTSTLDVPESKAERAQSVVWADRVFETRADLARWLRAHGVNYRVWARRHPGALGRQVSVEPKSTRSGPVVSKPLALGGVAVLFVVLVVFSSRRLRVQRLGPQLSRTSKRLLLRTGEVVRISPEHVAGAARAGLALRWYATGLILTAALCVLIAARV